MSDSDEEADDDVRGDENSEIIYYKFIYISQYISQYIKHRIIIYNIKNKFFILHQFQFRLLLNYLISFLLLLIYHKYLYN